VVFRDGEGAHWLADGFHRVEGARRAGVKRIAAEVREGNRLAAIEYSLGANSTHGLKRTNADKRRAVATALAQPEWAHWSDRAVAEACRVGHPLVAEVRSGGSSSTSQRVGRDGKSYPIKQGDTPASLADLGPGQAEEELHASRQSAPDEPAVGAAAAGFFAGLQGAEGECAADFIAGDEVTPDEPPIDMLGMASSAEWLRAVVVTLAQVELIDQSLRKLQATARSLPKPHQQRIYSALHDAAAITRSHLPAIACPMCADPDGTRGQRKACLSCAGLGWMSVEAAKGLHPSALARKAG
jgi:hypothetical protein